MSRDHAKLKDLAQEVLDVVETADDYDDLVDDQSRGYLKFWVAGLSAKAVNLLFTAPWEYAEPAFQVLADGGTIDAAISAHDKAHKARLAEG